MSNTEERGALVVLSAAAAALIIRALYRERATRLCFANLPHDPPPETVIALQKHRWHRLRHGIVRGAVSPRELERAFDAIRSAFAPQQVNYSNTAYGKNHWALSCFMEYSNGVAAGQVDLAKGGPMMAATRDILAKCDAAFSGWYDDLHPYAKAKGATRQLVRLQSFVTRYVPREDETHLPRHIDGANVDGSLVLGLPTYHAYAGGGLTVWDGKDDREEFVYPVGVGDACVLDTRVWHQSNPVRQVGGYGERWVVVIFYQVITTRPDHAPASAKPERSQAVRELLARRIVEAKRRKEATLEAKEALGPAAWSGGS